MIGRTAGMVILPMLGEMAAPVAATPLMREKKRFPLGAEPRRNAAKLNLWRGA